MLGFYFLVSLFYWSFCFCINTILCYFFSPVLWYILITRWFGFLPSPFLFFTKAIHGPLYFQIKFFREVQLLIGITLNLHICQKWGLHNIKSRQLCQFNYSFISYSRTFGFSSKMSYTFFLKVNSWIFYNFSTFFFCKWLFLYVFQLIIVGIETYWYMFVNPISSWTFISNILSTDLLFPL